MEESKALVHDDESGFLFAKEMLAGDVTAAVNFDRFMKHPEKGFIIMEYLLCEEEQMQKHKITPYSSHPNRYWYKNKRKFLSLWRATLDLKGTLYLVNYAKKGTAYENEILLIEVKEMNENRICSDIQMEYTRDEFKDWFRKLNKECLGPEESILAKNPIYVRKGFYHNNRNCKYITGKNDCGVYDKEDVAYFKGLKPCKECYPYGVREV